MKYYENLQHNAWLFCQIWITKKHTTFAEQSKNDWLKLKKKHDIRQKYGLKNKNNQHKNRLKHFQLEKVRLALDQGLNMEEREYDAVWKQNRCIV